YTYALNAEMLNKILARNNASLLPTTIEDRAELANHGPVEAEAQFEWSEERARVYKVAYDIVTELFAQEAIEINDSLLSILHRYLFDDQARLPLTILMEQLMGYRFSPAQLQHLKKEASWQRHYTQGSIAGILLAAVGAFWGGRKIFSGKTWIALRSGLTRAAKRSAAPAATKVDETVAHAQAPSVDELLAVLDRIDANMGLGTAAAKNMPKPTASQNVARLGKVRLFSQFPDIFSPAGFKGMLLLMGFSAATGGGYAGAHELIKILSAEDRDNGVIDFAVLSDQYYDRLAVQRLICLSHDMKTQALALKTPENLLPILQQTNMLYSEFELLKRINPSLVDLLPMPPEVSHNPETGEVSFERMARGKPVTETFPCNKLKGRPKSTLHVSVNQVLRDVLESTDHITGLQKAVAEEAEKKAAAAKTLASPKKP
ncbi:MAG: hypothetical protein AB7N80_11300, partial [Bdellovibrionales bacterium]